MASVSNAVPTLDELHEAIEAGNGALVARYAVSIATERNKVEQGLPGLIEAASDAKRNLDVAKASIKHFSELMSLCQSVLRELRKTY